MLEDANRSHFNNEYAATTIQIRGSYLPPYTGAPNAWQGYFHVMAPAFFRYFFACATIGMRFSRDALRQYYACQ
jgi:hypothetical protein